MKQKFTTRYVSLLFVMLIAFNIGLAQNSVLVNFGNTACGTSSAASFSLISNPLSPTPTLLFPCSLTAQLADFYNVFIAYNPKDNKIYVCDIRTGVNSKIWILDIGLPTNMTCPAVIPVTPTFSPSYISNNFEFDNNGDLWSFSDYNSTTGQCNMDNFDVNTGVVLNTRVLQFPAGNFPTAISSGDLTILPNGRMFATLGSFPSRLYEILNYNSTSGIATAVFLQQLPQSCYGIAFLNGILELTGANFTNSCYQYLYNISTNTLSAVQNFQNGQLPIDNASITPSIGTTKQLVNAVKINSNTADLTYEIYVKNYGNVILNNINVSDDLGSVFGAGNISNVLTSFVAGSNAAGLTLNASFNGTTVTGLLNPGQNLPNKTASNNNYFFKILVQCRVTNLIPANTYLNTAIGTGTIGNELSLVNVSDSSNNGSSAVVDPDNDGNAGGIGENIPTPFVYNLIPVRFISIKASLTDKNTAIVKWQIATPTVNADKFFVEYSTDGKNWLTLSFLNIINPNQNSYQYSHVNIPVGNLYYRIKQIDKDGAFIYSNVVLLQNKNSANSVTIYPNPAKNYIAISAPYHIGSDTDIDIELFDAIGRKLLTQKMNASFIEINTTEFPSGTYLLKIARHNEWLDSKKIMIVK